MVNINDYKQEFSGISKNKGEKLSSLLGL